MWLKPARRREHCGGKSMRRTPNERAIWKSNDIPFTRTPWGFLSPKRMWYVRRALSSLPLLAGDDARPNELDTVTVV
jgi:hypothetical protein